MAAELLTPYARATDSDGNPYSGAQWFFYAKGTLTPQAVFADAALLTSLGAVVTADTGGKFVPIYRNAALGYRGILKNASGSVTLHDIDPISSDVLAALAQADGSSVVMFTQSGTGAVSRTSESKLRDEVSAKDFGTDGVKIAAAIAAHQQVRFPTGAYANINTAITFPFGKTVKFDSGAVLTNTGTGTATYAGVAIREGYNPGALTGWTHTTAPYSYEGVSVELGGYGPRQFGAFGTPTALNGATKIPATATIANHANGVSGYVKNASITTGGVALYGEANRDAASALIWGLNTRSQDFGFGGLNVWGYEMDMNIDNVTTTAIGFDAVGGSTVEPTSSIAYQVQAIGIFTSPKKRWQYGFRSRDAGALIGMELGAQTDTATSPSQIFQMNYRNAVNAPVTGFVAQIDNAGNALLTGGIGTTLFSLRTPTSSTNQIQLLANALGFYGASPVNKQTVSAAATDPATTQTLANSLRALIINLGLAA